MFHRNTMRNTEGGTDKEEYRVAAVKDRVNTTMEVWMGLTAGCAQCHSHKFDPISQREYYQLFAIFNESEDAQRDDEAPLMTMPLQDEARWAKLREEIAGLETRMKVNTPEFEKELAQWSEKDRRAGGLATVDLFGRLIEERQPDARNQRLVENRDEFRAERKIHGPIQNVADEYYGVSP